MIDWKLIELIAPPIVGAFIGALISWLSTNREKLVTYYGHVSDFKIDPIPPNTQQVLVNTHSIVVKNNGRKTATNVRLGHNFLPPSFNVFPDTNYEINELPSGKKEIVFPRIVPKKELTISYLYYAPLTFNQINTTIESDEGPAKETFVLLQPQPPKWLIKVLWVLLVIGCISLVYILIYLVQSFAM